MSKPDYTGAKGSNAGDDYHELWALRQALTLLDKDTALLGMTVEGLRPEDEHGSPSDVFDGIDCALYFNGTTATSANPIEVIQFKYSAASPQAPWTTARLISSSAKTRNNSVLFRLATAFADLKERRNGSTVGIRLLLVSNQPADPQTVQLLRDIGDGTSLTGTAVSRAEKLRKAANLGDDGFREFSAALDLTQTGSRFNVKEAVLRAISTWTEGDAHTLTNSLLRFLRGKMMPESKGEWISREVLLTELGFSNWQALFPCPPQLRTIANPVPRQAAKDVVAAMVNGSTHLCLHGHGGTGKTTTLQEVERQLPAGSTMLVFDCYGAGTYLNSDSFRHRAKDAFLQLSNDLAVKLHAPLLLTRSDGVDYARAFQSRLAKAAETVAAIPNALLVIVVDAADNSIAAARKLVPPERSFVSDFLTLGDVPQNVRLLTTARTGRLLQLNLPDRFERFPLDGFTRDETATHVRTLWPAAPDLWIDEFHQLSNHNPRVQNYALSWADGNPENARDFLLPNGMGLDDVFRVQLLDARKKSGSDEPLDNFCGALAALPHPVPIPDLSAISGLTDHELADICSDLAPGIRVADGGVGFGDEDFEKFMRDEGADRLASMHERVADRFTARAAIDPYAATHLAAALYATHRAKEIINLVEAEPEPAALVDPILRRDVRLHRLRIAMQVCTETDDSGSMLRMLLVGAEAMRGTAAILNLMINYPDLAAAFMRESVVRKLLRDASLVAHHGPFMFHLIFEHALAPNRVAATAERRQLSAWLERRGRELSEQSSRNTRLRDNEWKISAMNIAAEIEARLLLAGPAAALDALRHWRPRRVNLEVARILTHRLILSGRANLVEACLAEDSLRSPWNLFLLVPLALAGRNIDLSLLVRSVLAIFRRNWIRLEALTGPRDEGLAVYWLDTILTACELLIARDQSPDQLIPVLKTFADETFRQADNLFTFNTSLIDLQLRAVTLLFRLQGRKLDATKEFLIEPEIPMTDPSSRTVTIRHREELHRFVAPLVNLYDARAQLLTKTIPSENAAEFLTATLGTLDDYSFSQTHGAFDMRKRAATAVAYLRCLTSISSGILLRQSLGVFGKALDPFGSCELAVLPVVALDPTSHAEVLEIVTKRLGEIIAQRTVASEKVEAILALARFVDPISRVDAEAIFKEGHKITEEMDTEAVHQLRAVAQMGIRGAPAMDGAVTRRNLARDLNAVSTDASIRLSDHEGFPWPELINALCALDFPVAIASCARWQDADRINLGGSLPHLLQCSVVNGSISSKTAAALLPLLDDWDLEILEAITTRIKAEHSQESDILIEELARDQLLMSTRGLDAKTLPLLRAASSAGLAPGPWLRRLEEAIAFLQTIESARPAKPADQPFEFPTPDVDPIIDLGKYSQFSSAETIVQIVQEELKIAEASRQCPTGRTRYVSARDILESIKAAVPVAQRAVYLSSLAAIAPNDAAHFNVADAITRAIQDWKPSLGVQMWCREHLPPIIVDRLPEFASGLSWGSHSSLPPLIEILSTSGVDVPTLLARAISHHVEHLSAATIYELTALIAKRMKPENAANALLLYLPRLVGKIAPADLEPIDLTDVPGDNDTAVAQCLFALMSDCDLRLRWRAAHCVRRLAHFTETRPILLAFRKVYSRTTDDAFRAAKEPFYWMAARLWWNVAINRIAHEFPDVLADFGPTILSIADDDDLPHVLIRAFAKETITELVAGGHLKLSAKERKSLSDLNTGTLPRRTAGQRYGRQRGFHDQSGRAFHFDSMDTIPYWYERALGMFADITMDEFLDQAERRIVVDWKAPTDAWQWDRQPRKYRFSERNWTSSSNHQGSHPTLERFSTYLEYHAMCCVIGDLVEKRPLVEGEEDDYNTLEGWLKRHMTASPPWWVADFRQPKPLESRFWQEPLDIRQWVDGATDPDFLVELGLGATHSGMIVAQAWHETASSSFSSEVLVNSALVHPTTGASLMRALQTANDPYDYKLPDEGEDQFEIGVSPYVLGGWLADSSESYSGFDGKDPFRRSVTENHFVPGPKIGKHLIPKPTIYGRSRWVTGGGDAAFEHEDWSDKDNEGESNRHYRPLESEGKRLWVSVEVLQKHLRETRMDLIVSIKLIREEGDGNYAQSEKNKRKARKAKIVILRSNGDIEGATGNIGTWQPHSSGAKS